MKLCRLISTSVTPTISTLLALALLLALASNPATATAAPDKAAAKSGKTGKPAKIVQSVTEPARGDLGLGKPAAKVNDFGESQTLDLAIEEDSGKGAGKDAEESQPATSGGAGAIGRMIFGLVFVLGLIYGVHRFLKNYKAKGLNGGGLISGGSGGQGALEVISSTPLSPNRMLHVVRVGSEYVLIGATDATITPIRNVNPADVAPALGGNAETQRFHQALNSAIVQQPAHMSMATGSSAPGTAAVMGANTPAPAGGIGSTLMQRFMTNLQMMTSR